MATTDYGQINQRTAAWAATEMLSHVEPEIVLVKFGQVKPLPKNTANQVKFRRPVPFAISTTPLVEGVTPATQAMSYEDVSATMAQYGATIKITDVVVDLAEDPVLKDASMLAGEQAGGTVEQVTYGVVKAGTSVVYANGSARNAVNSVITLVKQRSVVRGLKAQKAKQITRMLSPSLNISTIPIEAAYIAFAHTDVEQDIRDLAGFIPVVKYGTRKPADEMEIGSVENVRYILSADLAPFADAGGLAATNNTFSTTGTNSDVYPVLFVGKEAYGTIPLKGKEAIKPMVINPSTVTKSDPLAQFGFVSWKVYYAAIILNQAWMTRLEVAVSDLA